MKCKNAIGFFLVLGLVLCGCNNTLSRSKEVWIAQPEYMDTENSLFKIKIEPKKGKFPYYAYFRISITNTGTSNLVLDWNRSRYLFNGKPQGMLVFQGIDPEAVKAATIPMETIPPGTIFIREIMPMRLIAWSPVKEKTVERRSILPGMFPEGKNGVRLVVQHNDRAVTIPLSFAIIKKSAE